MFGHVALAHLEDVIMGVCCGYESGNAYFQNRRANPEEVSSFNITIISKWEKEKLGNKWYN